jgi:ring-1,2-phenylacetyl-CoA epoxidase subunit PaaE
MLKFFKSRKEQPADLLLRDDSRRSPKFHTLKVAEVRRETPDAVSIAFDVPADLKESYRFLPGQYLTLRTKLDGLDTRRSYSLCSSPLDGELRVAVKEVPGGAFSSWANQKLAVGTSLEVMTPEGGFYHQPADQGAKQYVGFAAGSGITPIMSIIKTTLALEPQSVFTLFYGNKNAGSIIFKRELEDLKDQYLHRLEIHHVLSREDQGTDWLKGRIDAGKCRHFATHIFQPSAVDRFFLCGPDTLIDTVKNTLVELGVADNRIRYELFTTPVAGVAPKKEVSAAPKKGILSSVTVILDGEETHFTISSNGETILDAALDAGADVPFACKGAVCCTCRAKVLEGSVTMDMNYALEEEEVEEGYVLTCQSHPQTDKVVVSYDA